MAYRGKGRGHGLGRGHGKGRSFVEDLAKVFIIIILNTFSIDSNSYYYLK